MRDRLIDLDLIAFDGTQFQILSLPSAPIAPPPRPLVTEDDFEDHDPLSGASSSPRSIDAADRRPRSSADPVHPSDPAERIQTDGSHPSGIQIDPDPVCRPRLDHDPAALPRPGGSTPAPGTDQPEGAAKAVIAGDRADAIGSVAMVVAIAIAALNFYISAVRPLVFGRRNGSLDGYKHISGLPVIGSLVVVAGAVVGSDPASVSRSG